MKTFAMCMQCQQELGHPSFEPFTVDYFDDSIAYIQCSAGHNSALVIQSMKFEILLESGANAYLDGYTLEACASFYAALERFYEFAIQVICLSKGISNKIYKEMFTRMSRQSERQLGAFMVLYLIEFGEPYILDEKIVKFRNSVIHKGVIPTPEKTNWFVSEIYKEIYLLYLKLESKELDFIRSVIFSELEERNRKIPQNMARATSSGTIFFNTANVERKPTFDEALKAYKEAQERIKSSIPYMSLFNQLIKEKK